jgi:hypothetical protein
MGDNDACPDNMWRRSRAPEPDPLDLDEETAERLLSGRLRPADAPPAYAGVARLLASAAAPEAPDEAQAAPVMAAFRAAHQPSHARSPARSRQARQARVAARAATWAAVLVVLTLLLAGGAVAAASGLRVPDLSHRKPLIERPSGATVPADPTIPAPDPLPRGQDVTRPNEGRRGTPAAGADPVGTAPVRAARAARRAHPVPTARTPGGAAGEGQEAAPGRLGQGPGSRDPAKSAKRSGSGSGKPPWAGRRASRRAPALSPPGMRASTNRTTATVGPVGDGAGDSELVGAADTGRGTASLIMARSLHARFSSRGGDPGSTRLCSAEAARSGPEGGVAGLMLQADPTVRRPAAVDQRPRRPFRRPPERGCAGRAGRP